MSIRTKNILTAALAVVLVGAFIFVAEGLKKDKKDDRLAAIENITTTTFRRTTTTRETTTTTATTLPSTTSSSAAAVAATTTTVRRTTTTRGATTATTRKPATTTTTPAPSFGGEGDEQSDNTGTFTRSASGAYSGNKAPACAPTDALCFDLGAEQGDNGQVRLVVQLRNNTNRTVNFVYYDANGRHLGLRVSVFVRQPDGSTLQFVLDATGVQNLAPAGERTGNDAVRVSSQTNFNEVGDYQYTAGVRVDYGS